MLRHTLLPYDLMIQQHNVNMSCDLILSVPEFIVLQVCSMN
jgi:hypothetical protein